MANVAITAPTEDPAEKSEALAGSANLVGSADDAGMKSLDHCRYRCRPIGRLSY